MAGQPRACLQRSIDQLPRQRSKAFLKLVWSNGPGENETDMAAPAVFITPEAAIAGGARQLLDILERSFHTSRSEWLFLRELRVGTGRRNSSAQRLDAFALNCLPHLGMKRICYEVKTSRADYLCELRQPLKRRIGMRYSNEFYFVVPGGMLSVNEVPPECGLIEAGITTFEDWKLLIKRQAGFFAFDAARGEYSMITVPAPWRDTPGPTWQFVAAMLRHQLREFEDRPPEKRAQQKLPFDSPDGA
jgi:hypothetical protein